MKGFICSICNKKLLVGNYKARLMHLKGTKHRLMLKTHYLEVLERQEVRNKLESLDKLSKMNLNKEKVAVASYKFSLPPCEFPSTFKIPQPPKNFKLPRNFDFKNKNNFDCDLQKAIANLRKSI